MFFFENVYHDLRVSAATEKKELSTAAMRLRPHTFRDPQNAADRRNEAAIIPHRQYQLDP